MFQIRFDKNKETNSVEIIPENQYSKFNNITISII